MDQDTYSDRSVNTLAADFVCVKIDGDSNRNLVQKYNVKGYPTTLFLNGKGVVVQRVRGYAGPGKFYKVMKSVLAKYSPPVKKREKREKKEKGQESPFKLAGIFYSSQNPKAIVNNTMVGVGDAVDGAKVIKISETRVTLFYQGKEIELAME